MSDAGCVALLRWALPQLGRRWDGYRNVRGQVCKRLQRRIAELGLADTLAYRARLEADPAEWKELDRLCIVTISRFYRDKRVWDTLREKVLPTLAERALADGQRKLSCWSLGCASGEEPYTLSILWTLALAARYEELSLEILATDVDDHVLERARVARYAAGTLRDVPSGWLEAAFSRHGDTFEVEPRFRALVELRKEDVREALPDSRFRLIFCKNLIFTYFDESEQRTLLGRLVTRLEPGGAFILGPHEKLPAGTALEPWHSGLGIYALTRTPRAPDFRR